MPGEFIKEVHIFKCGSTSDGGAIMCSEITETWVPFFLEATADPRALGVQAANTTDIRFPLANLFSALEVSGLPKRSCSTSFELPKPVEAVVLCIHGHYDYSFNVLLKSSRPLRSHRGHASDFLLRGNIWRPCRIPWRSGDYLQVRKSRCCVRKTQKTLPRHAKDAHVCHVESTYDFAIMRRKNPF